MVKMSFKGTVIIINKYENKNLKGSLKHFINRKFKKIVQKFIFLLKRYLMSDEVH